MTEEALRWVTAISLLCGIAAGPIGYWLRGRNDRRNAMPNIRRAYKLGTEGFTCTITIHARTSEDITVTRIEAGGRISLGKPEPEYGTGGAVTGYKREWAQSPAAIEWLIPAGETHSFEVAVDTLDDLSMRLILSSSSLTLKDKPASIHPPIKA